MERTRADAVGLCARCRHGREVPTAQVVYWLCGLAATDARYEKYPRLPVLQCDGFELEESGPP